MKRILLLSCAVVIISCKSEKKEAIKEVAEEVIKETVSSYKTMGTIERLSPKLNEIISENAKMEIIAEGYQWSEGPLWLETEQTLIWSDVPKNTIYSWKEGEDAKVYLTPSGYTGEEPSKSREPGSNGLLFNPDGKLVLSQHGDRRMAMMDAPLNAPEAKFVTIVDNFNGKKFSSPNDAVYDSEGNLFFTDPPYGLPGQNESEDKEIDFNGVYKVSTDGNVTMLVDSITRPNGIAFSPDFTKCYVASSDPKKAIITVYDISEEKTFTNGKIFFDGTSMVAQGKRGLPDGLKIDNKGNVFATGPGGVLIFSPDGEHLGTLNTTQPTANCCFNTDKSILYITANSYILRLELK